jgi:hypothetical protein
MALINKPFPPIRIQTPTHRWAGTSAWNDTTNYRASKRPAGEDGWIWYGDVEPSVLGRARTPDNAVQRWDVRIGGTVKKTKLRGITDRQLAAGFQHQDGRIMALYYQTLRQRSYNRVMGFAIGLLYLIAALHVAYFHYAGYYAWIGDYAAHLWSYVWVWSAR